MSYYRKMKNTQSPWLQELQRTRPLIAVQNDISTDIAIVGGGISGIVTAYFVLQETNHTVTLLEATKIAHGATGHNAGQAAAYFEETLVAMVKKFGLEQAIYAQNAVESAWLLLEQIHRKAQLKVPLYRFEGYLGCTTIEQILLHLENNFYRRAGGLSCAVMYIAQLPHIIEKIPDDFGDLYQIVNQQKIQNLLETHNKEYVAAVAEPKGCINSALFTEELAGYLLTAFPDRFSIFEQSPMGSLQLTARQAQLSVLAHTVTAQRVILCTNGYKHFTINNTKGADIDHKFHLMIKEKIGFMSGYLDPENIPPYTISYLAPQKITFLKNLHATYYYLTRRPYEYAGKKGSNLICIGGVEQDLDTEHGYDAKQIVFHEEINNIYDNFLRLNYAPYGQNLTKLFCWHGLMGYTPNRIRLIGPEPFNPILLYNLGCNGVGILPAIYGGKKIARFLLNAVTEQSIFDPQ